MVRSAVYDVGGSVCRAALAARRLLPTGRFPQFQLVAFWLDDVTERTILGLLDLGLDIAAFGSQHRQQSVEIGDPEIDHERSSAGFELIRVVLERAQRGNATVPSDRG